MFQFRLTMKEEPLVCLNFFLVFQNQGQWSQNVEGYILIATTYLKKWYAFPEIIARNGSLQVVRFSRNYCSKRQST
jgi:hypothetical protein